MKMKLIHCDMHEVWEISALYSDATHEHALHALDRIYQIARQHVSAESLADRDEIAEGEQEDDVAVLIVPDALKDFSLVRTTSRRMPRRERGARRPTGRRTFGVPNLYR